MTAVPDPSFGNVAPTDLLSVETLRLGLRSGTAAVTSIDRRRGRSGTA